MKNLVPGFILKKFKDKKHRGKFKAYTLFIDISGFTRITSELMVQGKEGAEVLSDIINSIFTPAIEIIYKHGGFISTFAGDAFTAVFCVKYAEYPLDAAYRIREAFKKYGRIKTRFGEFAISVKLGLSWGTVEYGIINTLMQNVFYFCGEAIDGCAYAEHKAKSMQIIADNNFLSRLQTRIKKERISNDYARLYPVSRKIKDLSRYHKFYPALESYFIPQIILDMKLSGEFREILSCFINMSKENQLESSINEIMVNCQAYGGYFNRLDFGDKGCNALILFGAPYGKENLYQRACDFALSLKSIPGFKFRAGLSAGNVFAGFTGSIIRSEYTALGGVVTLSARLMMKADWNAVYTDEDTALNIRDDYCFKSLGSLCLKGYEDNQNVYSLISRSNKKFKKKYKDRLIGREKEISQLKHLMKPVFQGKFGGIVYLDGDTGIGKSRLVFQLSTIRRCRFIFMPCDEIIKKSFNPIINYFLQDFCKSESNSIETESSNFYRRLESLAEDTPNPEIKDELLRSASFLGILIGFEPNDDLYFELDPKGRYENTLSAIKNFLLALSLQEPLIIVLEDSQWIDDESKEFFKFLIRNIDNYPLLILVLSRFKDNGELFHLKPEIKGNRIRLEPLNIKEMTEIICQRFEKNNIPHETIKYILEKSAGNPFYAEQIILYMTRNKLLDGKLNIIRKGRDIPSGINQIITARIDRLDYELKEMVKTASVLGKEFYGPALQKLILDTGTIKSKPRIKDTLKEGIAEKIWKDINKLDYSFIHPLIRDTAYEIQLKKRLRELHNSAGRVIEELFHDILDRYYEDLADHYEKAENVKKALCYLEKSADKAYENYRNQKALDLYERLLKFLSIEKDDFKIAEIHLIQAKILWFTGDQKYAIEKLEKSLDISEQINYIKNYIDGLNLMAVFKENQRDFDQVEKISYKSYNLAHEIDYKKGMGSALQTLGFIAHDQGQYEKAMDFYNRSLNIYRRLNNKVDIDSLLGNIASLYYEQGKYDKAKEHYQKCLSLAEDSKNYSNMITVLNNLGILYLEMNDLKKAMDYYEKALNYSLKTGYRIHLSSLYGNIGQLYHRQGVFDKALTYYKKDLELNRELGNKSWESLTIGLIAEIFLDFGKYHEALNYYNKSLGLFIKLGEKKWIGVVMGKIADVYKEMNHYKIALYYYEYALKMLIPLVAKYYLSEYMHKKAWILYKLSYIEKAFTLNLKAKDIATEIKRSEMEFECRILHHLIEKNTDVLMKLLMGNLTKEQTAYIYYILWQITDDQEYGNKARIIYQELFYKIPRFYYKKRILEILR